MANRSKLIQLVHVGAAKLFGRDEETRRDWQFEVSSRNGRHGQRSCSKMTNDQLEDLVADLRAKGALDKRPPRRAGRKPFNRSPYMAKVEAQLADMGLSWQYAESIAWRISGGKGGRPHAIDGQGNLVRTQPGVKKLEWFKGEDNWRALIAALDVEQEKRGLMQQITQVLKERGLDIDYIDTLVPENMHGTKWQRNRKWLQAILNHLIFESDPSE